MRKTLGTVARMLRKARNLTLEQVCEKLTDYDAGNLSRFENGQQRIVEDRLDELAAALGVKTWEMFRLREEDQEHTNMVQEHRPPHGNAWPFSVSVQRYEQLPLIDRARISSYVEATVAAWEAQQSRDGTGTLG